jgi:Na+-translocating ferredoxin:NAD+ oxidoreductase RnfC subunit
MRYTAKEDVFPSYAREYRKIPSDRWASTLGVKKFDKVAEFYKEISDFSRVEIPLSQHIGAPSIPTVNDGDTVFEGDLIARAADGLSLTQHASISGRVTIANGKIVIDRLD